MQRIYDTREGKKVDLQPREPGKVGIYACGVTVYDLCHVGHARTLIAFDVIVRHLRQRGLQVRLVRNITDVDDKIIRKGHAEGRSAAEVAKFYADAMATDMAALGIAAPDIEPRATDHIAEMIDVIRRLEERGLAYAAEGDVYYSVSGFPGYGSLSGQSIDDLQAGARIEVGEHKRSPLDFTLWKGAKPGEPQWPSPWGPGRPGWHIECSAMAHKYLGDAFDIHGGGSDLIFPHHENEIAQSEGAFGSFARHWMHSGMVNFGGEKMSKSLGNVVTIRRVAETHDLADDLQVVFHQQVVVLDHRTGEGVLDGHDGAVGFVTNHGLEHLIELALGARLDGVAQDAAAGLLGKGSALALKSDPKPALAHS